MALGSGTRLGRYKLLGRLGSGGMGEVYRAHDPELQREVAIKILPPEVAADRGRLKRFRHEARIVARLGHPNVLTIHDVGRHRGRPFLVTELLEGETLRRRLQRGALPVARALDCATQIARGLAAAHERNIVHRDLKPENVFLTRDGRMKILDFGVAKLHHPPPGDTGGKPTQTDPAARMGTPGYMSPEQVRGLPLDHRSDIFSLGSVLLEMLSGRGPFERDTPAETMTAILREEPAALPRTLDLPLGLRRLIQRCLRKEREGRFQTTHDLALALEALSEPGRASPGAWVEEAWPAGCHPSATARKSLPGREAPPALVARDGQLAELERHLQSARAGQGRVVFLTGEAGSGKTALASEFGRRMRWAHPDLVVASGIGNAHTGTGDPYLPFREILGLLTGDVEARRAAGSLSGDHASRLSDLLPVALRALVEAGGDLLDTFIPSGVLIARAEAHAPGGADWLGALRRVAERRSAGSAGPPPAQANLFEQYCRVIRAVAGQHPLLLVLDDLQWADSGSVGLLFQLARQLGSSRVLILGLYRPSEIALGRQGERHPLESVVHELQRASGQVPIELGDEGDRPFVDALLDSEPNRLGRGFRESLFRQTRGHPLFTVELLRGLREQRVLVKDDEGRWRERPGLTWDVMPARVEGVIAQRIGRLSPSLRRVLAVASLEGEEFTAEVVARLVGIDPGELIRILSDELDRRHHLVRARGLLRQGGRRLSQYRFRHFLFQKYLYGQLDAVERAELHERMGRALEELHGKDVIELALPLARHYCESAVPEKAIEYLMLAADRARRASAYEEAAAHLRQALNLVRGLPEDSDRIRREMALQIDLGWAAFFTRGYGTPEAGEALGRAWDLSRQLSERARSFELATTLFTYRMCRAEHAPALELAETALAAAQELADDTSMVVAESLLGAAKAQGGRLAEARAHFEQALARHAASGSPPRIVPTLNHELGQLNHSIMARWLWILGYADQAARWAEKGEEEARRLSHAHSLAHASFFAALVHLCRRDVAAVRSRARLLERVASKWGFPLWLAGGRFMGGWCRAQQGPSERSIDEMREALKAWSETGCVVETTNYAGLLATAYASLGRRGEALGVIRETLASIEAGRNGERFQLPELHRIEGELLLRMGSPDSGEQAERCLRRAIEVARHQDARSWELRATTSLARFLADRGGTEEAREALSESYGWFTEGLDTPDLRDARELLDEMRSERCRNQASRTTRRANQDEVSRTAPARRATGAGSDRRLEGSPSSASNRRA
jgi:adenylate cyclase